MRIRCWVRAISSRCTELTSSSCSRARSRSAGPDREQLLLAARCGRPRPRRAPRRRGGSTPRAGPAPRSTATPDRLGRHGPRGPAARAAAIARARASRSASAARTQRVGPAVQGAGPLLARCAARAGRPSRPGGRRGPPRRGARARWCRAPRRVASSAAARRALEVGRGRRGPARGPRGRSAIGRGDAARPRPRADAGLRAELAELLGHRGQGRVGLVQLGQRDVDAAAGRRPLALEPRRCRSRAARRRRPPRRAASEASSTRGLDLEQARLADASRRRRSGRRARRPRGSPR